MTNTLALKLNHVGFMTKIAFDGLAALEMLAHASFDLILLDLILPKLDGLRGSYEVEPRKTLAIRLFGF